MLTQKQLKEVETLFSLGAHMGHKKSRLHPRARKNVYQIINGTSVIDLTNTVLQIQKAEEFLYDAAKSGKSILVVGTKKTASAIVREYCEKNTLPYVSAKWLPGLLTNFKTIMENVKKLEGLRAHLVDNSDESIVKHEKVKIQKQILKLERLYGGFSLLKKLPDILILIDVKKEKNALKEAKSNNIPVVGLIDTNANPDEVTIPVVCNDDTTEVVKYVIEKLLGEFVRGKTSSI
jgi:small subunit ribosomal protein S2